MKKPTIVNDHALDNQIVDFFGLNSVMDINQVEDEGYRYRITLEDGTIKIATKAGLNCVSENWAEDAVYKVVSRFNRHYSVAIIEMIDTKTQAHRKIVARNISSIIKPGMLVTYKNFNLSVAN